jgi:hypothetical protein
MIHFDAEIDRLEAQVRTLQAQLDSARVDLGKQCADTATCAANSQSLVNMQSHFGNTTEISVQECSNYYQQAHQTGVCAQVAAKCASNNFPVQCPVSDRSAGAALSPTMATATIAVAATALTVYAQDPDYYNTKFVEGVQMGCDGAMSAYGYLKKQINVLRKGLSQVQVTAQSDKTKAPKSE